MHHYRSDIDGLRAFAVLAVVGFHAFPNMVPGGYVGVDIFFVISGFLITRIILEAGDKFSFVEFYRRRCRRIFPALTIMLLFTLMAGWVILFADEFYRLGLEVVAGASFSANILFWSQAGYFDAAATTKPLLHLWSLAVEEQFYLLWPLLIFVCRGRLNLSLAIVVILLASFALCVWQTPHSPSAAFYLPLSRFWELMIGACIASTCPTLPKDWRSGLSLIGVSLIAIATFLFVHTNQFPGWIASLPTVGAAVLIVSGPDAIVNRLLSWRPMVWIGLISYPLYLWHWPLLTFLRITSGNAPSNQAILAVIAISFVLAALTYLVIEKPVRRFRCPAMPIALSLAMIGLFGLSVIVAVGYPSRSAAAYATLMQGARPANHGLSDGSCDKIGHHLADKEVCLTAAARPEILILGDSHAMSLNSGARSLGLNAMLIAGSSCLPFTGYTLHGSTEPNSNRNCDGIAANALNALSKLPSIKTVVLATMGPTYFADRGDYHIYQKEVQVEDPEAAFVDGYVETIRSIQNLGKRVIFLIDNPELGFDPKDCIERQIGFPRKDCTLARSALTLRQTRYRTLVQEIERSTGAIIFDPTDLFCNSLKCSWHDGTKSWYFDQHHLSIAGSSLIIRKMIDDGLFGAG